MMGQRAPLIGQRMSVDIYLMRSGHSVTTLDVLCLYLHRHHVKK